MINITGFYLLYSIRNMLNKLTHFIKKYQRLIILILSILISLVIIIFKNSFAKLGSYGYLGLFIFSVFANATIILPVPTFLAAIIGGMIYNPVLAAIVVSLGATIGELTGYFIGYGARGTVIVDHKIQKVQKYMNRYGLWFIFVLAIIPNPLFDIAGITAGITEISIYKYLGVVFLGKLIKFIALAYLGSGFAGALENFI